MAETSASKDVKTFKFGKYTVFLENHFYWKQATLSKIRRKEHVMESFLRN